MCFQEKEIAKHSKALKKLIKTILIRVDKASRHWKITAYKNDVKSFLELLFNFLPTNMLSLRYVQEMNAIYENKLYL